MQLPLLRYAGTIHLVKTNHDLQRAVHDFRRERVVGIDTETRPTFKKGQAHAPALVQVATGGAVYLFQLTRLDCSLVLADLFANAQLVKAGISLAYDLSELRKLFPFETANVVDLGEVAKKNGMQQTGARNLAGLFLGGRITKSAQTSNWAQPDLTAKQICYAATDAWVCRELYLRFESLGLLHKVAAKTHV
jgi:ribonuclease D